MHRVLVLGAGKIGSLVACLLSESGDYEVSLGDISLDKPLGRIEADVTERDLVVPTF